MNARQRKSFHTLLRWGAPVILFIVLVVFMGSVIRGIVKGTATAHDLDHSDAKLDERLVELADLRGTAPLAALPIAAGDDSWDVACYVDSGAWVGKMLAEELDIDVDSFHFDPRNIYVVEDYWAVAFLDRETGNVRIAEVNRKSVARFEGPVCVDREGAEVTARPLDADHPAAVITISGTPPSPQ